MTPKRIQMSRQRLWRAEHPDAVIVARPSKWGNPYTIEVMQQKIDDLRAAFGALGESVEPRAMAVDAFRCDLELGPDSPWWWYGPHMQMIAINRALQTGELRGRDLACWCALDQPCHADVLLELANPKPHDSETREPNA